MRRPSVACAGARRTVVLLAVVLTALPAALVLLAGTAAADVTVAASRAEAGARDVTITFRVTNDDPAVPTTRLQVFLPTVRPLLGVVPTAPTGWTARVDQAPPAAPLTVDGTAATAVPVAVTWQGGRLTGPGYAVFPIDVARLPDGAGPLRFHVVQTDARGGIVEWSDLLPSGMPQPAHPALTVAYTSPGVPAAPPVAGAAHHHHDDPGDLALPTRTGSVARTGAIAALVALVVAVWVTALGRRQRRRMAAVARDRPEDRPLPPPRVDGGSRVR